MSPAFYGDCRGLPGAPGSSRDCLRITCLIDLSIDSLSAQMLFNVSKNYPKGYPLNTIFGRLGSKGGNVKTMVLRKQNSHLQSWRGSRETSCATLCAQSFSTCFSERCFSVCFAMWAPKGVPREDPRRPHEPGGNVKTMVSFGRNHHFRGWRELCEILVPHFVNNLFQLDPRVQRPPRPPKGVPKGHPLDTILGRFGSTSGNVKTMALCN